MRVPEQVVSWMRENAVPLTSVTPGGGTIDLQSLRQVIGDARLVGLGESTYGTHEFLTLKHRLIEFLVDELAFDTVALETNWPEAEIVDDHITRGEGTVATAVRRLHGWALHSEETVDLVESLRRRAVGGRQVQFRGAHIGEPHLAADRVVEFLRIVDPEAAASAATAYAFMEETWPRHNHPQSDTGEALRGWQAYVASPDRRKRQSELLLGVCKELSGNLAEYGRTTSTEACRDAIAYAEAVVRADSYQREQADASSTGSLVTRARRLLKTAIRPWYRQYEAEPSDVDIASTVAAMVAEERRVVFLAHNAHVGAVRPHVGWHLTKALGGDYIRIGLVALSGSFNARCGGSTGGVPGAIASFQLPVPHPGGLDEALAGVGLQAFMLDLRTQAPGIVRDWLETPCPLFMAGTFVNDPERLHESVGVASPRRAFDVVICLTETTPSKLLASATTP